MFAVARSVEKKAYCLVWSDSASLSQTGLDKWQFCSILRHTHTHTHTIC